jgi:hypothetical protein
MPKWWNEQQVCGTYTREAHTVGARTGEKGAHGHGGTRGKGGHAQPRGGTHSQGAGTARGGARLGGAHGQGARMRTPLMVAAAPRHVGGVGAYARAYHWGANRGRARLQGGAYICFALLI